MTPHTLSHPPLSHHALTFPQIAGPTIPAAEASLPQSDQRRRATESLADLHLRWLRSVYRADRWGRRRGGEGAGATHLGLPDETTALVAGATGSDGAPIQEGLAEGSAGGVGERATPSQRYLEYIPSLCIFSL